ncbi:uncharacterized protein M6B38_411605 [Iris pallida]|uniref:F-box domain-containing protein n=1 Tax=Iris pallida TaxID=29817 RepID=A0AAX6FML6_IRIPA|nr:uncharacterized protein M6B38_411605 [Iris pallida]
MPEESESGPPPVSSPPPPILLLPHDSLLHILSLLPLRQLVLCRLVCRHFAASLTSPPPATPPLLPLLALRHPRHCYPHPHSFYSYDPLSDSHLHFPLDFLPFSSTSPITSSTSLLYLWASTSSADTLTPCSQPKPPKSLIVSNPVTRRFKTLPQLGSAWSRHGTVLAGPAGAVIVLAELAALYYSPSIATWRKFSLNLPSKPRSPVLVDGAIYTLCDVGAPWRSQWKLFGCGIEELGSGWGAVEKEGWGDVFDVLKRPRLVRGGGEGRVLMVGGLRSGYGAESPCSTVMILRLDLGRMEWEEAGKMPLEMYKCFAIGGGVGGGGTGGGNNKVKVFGGEGRVWFSGRRVRGRMAMWEEAGEKGEGEEGDGGRWRWVECVPGYGDFVYRGFVYNAGFAEIP